MDRIPEFDFDSRMMRMVEEEWLHSGRIQFHQQADLDSLIPKTKPASSIDQVIHPNQIAMGRTNGGDTDDREIGLGD